MLCYVLWCDIILYHNISYHVMYTYIYIHVILYYVISLYSIRYVEWIPIQVLYPSQPLAQLPAGALLKRKHNRFSSLLILCLAKWSRRVTRTTCTRLQPCICLPTGSGDTRTGSAVHWTDPLGIWVCCYVRDKTHILMNLAILYALCQPVLQTVILYYIT